MVARVLAASYTAAFVFAAGLALLPSAHAEDLLKVAVAQRGQWDTAITELGERYGIFKKRGIAAEILYTQGGPEAHQAVISGSMDIACGGGIESSIGGFCKSAPVRVCMANAQVLGTRGDAVARFMQGYRDALDWMYADPAALQMYEAFSNVRHELMAKVRDQYFPKPTLWPDEVRGLDLVLSDALKNRFTARPLTPAEVKEMIQIPAPM